MLFPLLLTLAVALRLAGPVPQSGLLWIGRPPSLAVRLVEAALDDRTWRDDLLAYIHRSDPTPDRMPSLRPLFAADDTRYIPGIGRRRRTVRP